MDVVIYVLRCFRNEKIVNVQPEIDILKDKEILDMEMALKDLETVEKRIHSLEKEVRANEKGAVKESEVLIKTREFLRDGKILTEQEWSEEEKKILKSYQFLTLKPRLYLLNGQKSEIPEKVRDIFRNNDWLFLIIDILTEFEAADLKPEERESFGLPAELNIDNLIGESYKLLDLITFLTTGPDETRAWELKKGLKAPQAGGAIHSDFEKNFIKAEVINWQDLITAGGFAKAREKGLIRTEGKDYIIKDGDVVEIKHG